MKSVYLIVLSSFVVVMVSCSSSSKVETATATAEVKPADAKPENAGEVARNPDLGGIKGEEKAADPAVQTPEVKPADDAAKAAAEAPKAEDAPKADAEAPAIAESAAAAGGDYYVSSAGLNVRSLPSMEGEVKRQLKHGEKVKALGREGIWVMIGENEYVSIRFLTDRPVVASTK